jgi:hypothetical protein
MTDKDQELQSFLSELTELSRKYKTGITGTPILFVMDNDDYERVYTCDAQSSLDFA